MPNQNQFRLWWTICIGVLGGCESFAPLNSKSFSSVQYLRTVEASVSSSSILHSSSPVYYREELLAEQKHRTAVCNEKSVSNVSTSVDDSHASSLSIPLINEICLNQATLLLFASSVAVVFSFFGDYPFEISNLHWNEIQDFRSLFDWQPSLHRLTEGIFAAIPITAIGRLMETSDDRNASQFNFATTNMVISLFGRRKSAMEPKASTTFQVMLLSAIIAVSSGISEEIIFRGYIPTAISTMTHSLPLALFGQSVLFAGGHLSMNAEPRENELNGSFQLFNGLWYGGIYLATGGDILPCIVAHVLCDMHTLCKTWIQVNDQMDYTQESSMKCMGQEEKNAVEKLKHEVGVTLNPETVDFARHFFYAFDNDHLGRLSLSDCQRAVSYAFMNDKTMPDNHVVRDLFEQVKEKRRIEDYAAEFNDRLDFSEFLHVLFVLRSNSREYSR